MTATYEAIATTTLGSAQATVTFSSISGSYTDIVAVVRAQAGGNLKIQFNSDTGNNYSNTVLFGNGTSALSARNSNTNGLIFGTTPLTLGNGVNIYHIMNYSNTTTNKTVIARGNELDNNYLVRADVGLWRSTSAITSITFVDNGAANFATGSTFTLYGIKAE